MLISQHSEEAALCWSRRDRGASEPHYLLSDVGSVDNQLEAHLDGLRVAGNEGWRNCEAELRWQEPGEFFVAAALAMESGDPHRIELVLQRALEHDQLTRAVASALGWLPLELAQPFIDQFAAASDAQLRKIAVAGAANHRFDLGDRLRQAIADDDPRVRARTLRAIAELGRLDLSNAATDHLHSEDNICRAEAAFALARLANFNSQLDAEGESALCELVVQGPGGSYRHLQMLMHRTEPPRARELIQHWFSNSEPNRTAVPAAGLLGDPRLVPWLVDQFSSPPLARLAGEAFTMITGLALDERPFEGEWPEGFEAGPNDDPADENVEMDPDENLPWPNRTAITDWWVKHRDDFKPGVRYLLGRPIDDEAWLEHVLRYGYQRQRAAAALELAIRRPTEPLFNVAAPTWRQKKLLGLK